MKYNEANERVKREYCQLLKHAKGKSETTIDGVRKSIKRYEDYTHFKDFSTFHQQQVIAFKEHLYKQTNERTGRSLSKATLLTTCNHIRGFFEWLSIHPDYRRKIDLSAINYLNLSENDKRTAKSSKAVKFPTIEQIQKVVQILPYATDIERRNRALFAFTILTGVRVNALISLKLRHVDIANGHVTQDPNDVHTKFGKLIETFFFPVGNDIMQIVIDWVEYLTKEKLYGLTSGYTPI